MVERWLSMGHLLGLVVRWHGLLAAQAPRDHVEVTFRHIFVGLCHTFWLTHWFRGLFFTAKLALYHLHAHHFPFTLLLVFILPFDHLVPFSHSHSTSLLSRQADSITETEWIRVWPAHILVFQTDLDVSDRLRWHLPHFLFSRYLRCSSRHNRGLHVLYIGLVVLRLVEIVASVDYFALRGSSSHTLEVGLEIIGTELGQRLVRTVDC